MAMSAGAVAVASDESVAGGGMARDIYDAEAATLVLPIVPTVGDTTGYGFSPARPCVQAEVDQIKAARLAQLQDSARRANAYAAGIVTHIQSNAKAVVNVAGLQRTPSPNNPNTATLAPASPVDLSVI